MTASAQSKFTKMFKNHKKRYMHVPQNSNSYLLAVEQTFIHKNKLLTPIH